MKLFIWAVFLTLNTQCWQDLKQGKHCQGEVCAKETLNAVAAMDKNYVMLQDGWSTSKLARFQILVSTRPTPTLPFLGQERKCWSIRGASVPLDLAKYELPKKKKTKKKKRKKRKKRRKSKRKKK